ncbi:MAG: toprim domain-containing protein [Proteobacteria bacterium]|nr:toprim domain-containing protein [Pseudomonadota bacterium]
MGEAAKLAHRLAENAETVCRHYLSSGRRQGRYWLVGDVHNTPGRSLYVRLRGVESGPGAVGKWTDAATGEHGDLLDLIGLNRGLARLCDVLDEARHFLRLPQPDNIDASMRSPVPQGSPESARRLFAMSKPLGGTLAETYLRSRRITQLTGLTALRFHSRCYYRPDHGPTEQWPALVAAVTDLSSRITGTHRTWLDPSGVAKAPIETPRRAMGHLLGNAVRFGIAEDVMAAGEGIETMLSLRDALPDLPLAAALSANHLAAMLFPPSLRVLYIAGDADPAGDGAVATLTVRSQQAGIEARLLASRLGDFNDDLRRYGRAALRESLRIQLAREHAARFLPVFAGTE